MALEVLKMTLGPLQTNCYIVGDTETCDAVVIDPSDRATLILQTVTDRGWTVREILATHGHFDHILASAELKMLTEAPFRAHLKDLHMITTMPDRVREWIKIEVGPAAEVDAFVTPGEVITVGNIALEVLFTPGHSPGHVSYVLRSGRLVFSGDCLFLGSIGRTDLAGGNYNALMNSIVTQLLPLGDDFTVAPGHMHNTTIGYERVNNPHVLAYLAEQEAAE
jgi:hydroxyacylglutathione hydrolase